MNIQQIKKVIIWFSVLFILLAGIPVSDVLAGECKQNDPPGTVSLCNPLGADATPQTLIGRVIIAILGIVGSLALAMFVYGGVVWMTAAGSPEKVKKGKDILLWAVVGLVVVFSAYALVNFVIFQAIGAK